MLEEIPYRSLIVEGIKYFYSRTDRVIPQDMLRSGLNWAGGDIENFVKAADRIFYRDVPTNTGIFLDIGGNIGTTSIYCKMKLKNQFRFIAFEPLKECARLFAANCAINGVDDDISVEQVALSSKKSSDMLMYINEENLGGSGLVAAENAQTIPTEKVSVTALDSYLDEKGIQVSEIKYAWIDVEGHEVEVLEGASQFYKKHKVPTFVEFNQHGYKMWNTYDKMVSLVTEYFDYFITSGQLVKQDFTLRPIEEISMLWEELEHKPCDVMFV